MTESRGTRVYVGNLTDKVKKEDLEGEFTKYGKLNSVWVAFNPPGFAFVEFKNRDDAEKACDIMNGTEILGSQLRVEISRDRPRQGRRTNDGSRDFNRRDVGSFGGFRNSNAGFRSSRSSGNRYGQNGSYNGSSRYSSYNAGRESESFDVTRRGGDGYTNGRNGTRTYSTTGFGNSVRRGSQEGSRFRSRSPSGSHRF